MKVFHTFRNKLLVHSRNGLTVIILLKMFQSVFIVHNKHHAQR